MENVLRYVNIFSLCFLFFSVNVSQLALRNRYFNYLPESRIVSYIDLQDTVTCTRTGMMLKVPKDEFIDLTIKFLVVDANGRYVFAEHIASQCKYSVKKDLDESWLFETAYDGCYVQMEGNQASLQVVLLATAADGRIEITENVPVKCIITTDVEPHPTDYPMNRSSVCTEDGFFQIVIWSNVTKPHLVLDSVYVSSGNAQECKPAQTTAAYVKFRFPLNSCGARRTVSDGKVTYSVDVLAKGLPAGLATISRDSVFRLTARCHFNQEAEARIAAAVLTVPPPFPARSDGEHLLELRIAKDVSYADYYTSMEYPVIKLLRKVVYIEVRILNRVDPKLVLLLDDCWATPDKDPYMSHRWKLLEKGSTSTVTPQYAQEQNTIVLCHAAEGKEEPKDCKFGRTEPSPA
ncbi:zona pellucida sperm-binding protein 4-like isoform X2 [Acipenser ruthenus]|uniref:zona pellucida sperm-binding protein 4-like isoform X2 n=1 Tax=Acipenser ruthenus TaxID=7906 RepID=UPI002741B3DE|nr:zona pellucida sperm-binding protein 4-like isoform X2 [Acipenser ruthenus]